MTQNTEFGVNNNKVIIGEDFVTITENGEEVVTWIQTEWEEDSNIVISIINAVCIAMFGESVKEVISAGDEMDKKKVLELGKIVDRIADEKLPTCEICGKKGASDICEECDRTICEECIGEWTSSEQSDDYICCKDCQKTLEIGI